MPQNTSNTRLHGLDTLRALAIATVVIYHIGIQGLLPAALNPVIAIGWAGVDLFFVLSGFLIGSQLLRPYREGTNPSTHDFYVRRAYRILPAFCAVLALYIFVPAWREAPGPAAPTAFWPWLTFTWNLVLPGYPALHAFSHVWSLCVEEHFYLLLPLVLALAMRRPNAWVTITLLAALVLGGLVLRAFFLYRVILSPATPEDSQHLLMMKLLYYPTYSRLDSLVVGVGLALLRTFRPRAWSRCTAHGDPLLLAGVATLALAGWLFGFAYPSLDLPRGILFGFPTLAVGFGLLVASAVSSRGLLARRLPGASLLATLAYSTYLSHKAVVHLTHQLLPQLTGDDNWQSAAIYAVTCLAAATLLYLCVERPFLRLRLRRSAHQASRVAREIRLDPAI